MKYDNKYGDSDDVDFTAPEGVFRSERAKGCGSCGNWTIWLDAALLEHLCSEECSYRLWNDIRRIEMERTRRTEAICAALYGPNLTYDDLHRLLVAQAVASPQ